MHSCNVSCHSLFTRLRYISLSLFVPKNYHITTHGNMLDVLETNIFVSMLDKDVNCNGKQYYYFTWKRTTLAEACLVSVIQLFYEHITLQLKTVDLCLDKY